MTVTTIDIDGAFLDWNGPLGDTDNVITDQVGSEDPDNPPQGDRDIVHMAAAFDTEYLYVYWRRSTSVNRSVEYVAYIDLDGDGKVQDGEPVVCWGFNGSTFTPNASSSGVGSYEAVASDGDTLTPNGVDMPGSVGALSLDAGTTGAGNGLEFETRVSWAALGFTDSDPPPIVQIHFACGQNLNLPSGITDNGGNLWLTQYHEVSIDPDRSSGASEDTVVVYAHTVTNSGNGTETILLTANSTAGWGPVISATAGGSAITSVTLGPEQSTTVYVAVTVPAGASGSSDVTTVRAQSSADTDTVDTAIDTTYVGALAVYPDHEGSTAASTTIAYVHTVTNNGATEQTINLDATSSRGWNTTLYAADGSTTVSSVVLGSGESTTVIVTIDVTSTAGIGMQDVTTFRAELASDSSTYSSATDITTVMQGLTISPDCSGPAGPGTTISYDHIVTNSWPETRTISLTASSALGWDVAVFAADGITEIPSITLGPNGDTGDIIVRVTVPSGTGSVTDTTTITAASGDASDTCVDYTHVSLLATYSDALYAMPSDAFVLGNTVYTRGMGLTGYRDVRFRWTDASGTIVYTSADLPVDAQGITPSSYSIPGTATVGLWTLTLLNAADGLPITDVQFTVSPGGEITHLYATNAPTLASTVSVDAAVSNSTAATITASTMNYVIWWDEDADGVFGAGDTYIDSSGMPFTYDGTSTVSTNQTSGIDVAPGGTWSDAGWSVNNLNFPYRGTYNVTATWSTSNGTVIDVKTTQFFSVPAMGAALVLFAAVLLAPLLWMLRKRRMWLSYYLIAAFGTTLLIVLFTQQSGLEGLISTIEGGQAVELARLIGLPVSLAPDGQIVIAALEGWSVLAIGVECSAIIEIAVLIGLVMFYPGFPLKARVKLTAVGVAATYLINLARLVIIVAFAALSGPQSMFIAHAVVGRAFFFVLVVGLYWVLLTRSTLRFVAEEQTSP